MTKKEKADDLWDINDHNIYTAYIDVDLSFTQETLARSKADAESYFNQLTLADIISLLKEKESLKTNPSLECEIEIVHDSVQKINLMYDQSYKGVSK